MISSPDAIPKVIMPENMNDIIDAAAQAPGTLGGFRNPSRTSTRVVTLPGDVEHQGLDFPRLLPQTIGLMWVTTCRNRKHHPQAARDNAVVGGFAESAHDRKATIQNCF